MNQESFTDQVRQEVARLPLGTRDDLIAELAALLRVAGAVVLRTGHRGFGVEVTTSSGAVARRAHLLLHQGFGIRPDLKMRSASGIDRRPTYVVGMGAGSAGVLDEAGVVGAAGEFLDDVPDAIVDASPGAWLRGAVLAGASFSTPGRAPHLEIGVRSARVADQIAARLGDVIDTRVHVTAGPTRRRVVVKSGRAIGDLLAYLGASQAFLRWDDQRLRHELRGDANRLANADTANLRRSVTSAERQVRQVQLALTRHDLGDFPAEVQEVALARLANPAASLAELGELLDPPVGKSTVSRRLARIVGASTLGADSEADA